MKKLRVILFLSGMLIQLAALFGDHAAEIPFMVKLLTPKYHHADNALNILDQNRIIGKDTEGFDVITNMLLQHVVSEGLSPRARKPEVTIRGITIEDGLRYSGDRKAYTDPIGITIHVDPYPIAFPGQPTSHVASVIWSESKLRGGIEKLKEPNVLVFCIVVFAVGTILEAVAFFMEERETPKLSG